MVSHVCEPPCYTYSTFSSSPQWEEGMLISVFLGLLMSKHFNSTFVSLAPLLPRSRKQENCRFCGTSCVSPTRSPRSPGMTEASRLEVIQRTLRERESLFSLNCERGVGLSPDILRRCLPVQMGHLLWLVPLKGYLSGRCLYSADS